MCDPFILKEPFNWILQKSVRRYDVLLVRFACIVLESAYAKLIVPESTYFPKLRALEKLTLSDLWYWQRYTTLCTPRVGNTRRSFFPLNEVGVHKPDDRINTRKVSQTDWTHCSKQLGASVLKFNHLSILADGHEEEIREISAPIWLNDHTCLL